MTITSLIQKKYVTIEKTEPVSKLVSQLKMEKVHSAIIVDGKGYYLGMSDKTKMYTISRDLTKMNAEHVMTAMPSLSLSTKIPRAAELLYTANTRMLAVLDKNEIQGVIRTEDIVKALQKEKIFKGLTGSDIAETKLITLQQEKTMGEAIKKMRDNNINRIPIVDATQKLKGVLSFRHILNNYLILPEHGKRFAARQATEKLAFSQVPVVNDMITNVKTASPEESVANILALLLKDKGHQVILTEKNKPMGIVTLRDILRVYLEGKETLPQIQFSNLPELDEIDKSIVDRTVLEGYHRLEKILNNDIQLTINVKMSQTSGLRKKYTMNAKLMLPGKSFNASATEWMLITTVQQVLGKLEKEVKKRMGKGSRNEKS